MMDLFNQRNGMNNYLFRTVAIGILAASLVLTGCRTKSNMGEGAKKGGAYGVLGGAVSGFFWGLFSGNPLQGATQGAVVGGATGATLGAVHGSSKDHELKKEYGEINYKALMALVERKYSEARRLVAQTANDPNPQFKHASIWLSALIASETLSPEEMTPYYEALEASDSKINSIEDAKVEVRLAQRDLKSLRSQLHAD